MAFVIQVSEVSFKDNLPEIQQAAESQILAWLEAIGQDAAATAAAKAPVDTGELKNSISPAVVPAEQAVYIGTNVEYAKWQELGTGIYAEDGGRQTPWAYKDRDGVWHYTHGVPAKHFLQFGCSAHAEEYGRMLERFLKQ